MKKKYQFALGLLALVLGASQIFRPESIPNSPANDLSGLPQEVNHILRNSCYDCHSSQTDLRWYDKITPFNFVVTSHVKKGRAAFSFSDFDSLTTAQQNTALYYALNKALSGEMPLPSYTMVHPEKRLKPEEIKQLKEYLQGRTPRQIPDLNKDAGSSITNDNKVIQVINTNVAHAPNGVAYIKNWRNWTAISTTNRFDNGSIRIIYGNDIAVRAIQEKRTNPYPNGAILAKAAWKQKPGTDGTITPGAFIQVEFMIRDSKKYSAAKGWGWARWKGPELKPYGSSALVVNECIACHHPVKNNDYVFTEPLALKPFPHSK